MIDKNQIVAIAGLVLFGSGALYLFQLAGFDDVFLNNILSKTINSTMTNTPLINTYYFAAGILALAISFASVGVYALEKRAMDMAVVIAGAIMLPLALLFIGMSATGAVLGVGLFLSMMLMQYLPIDDAEAYKELRPAKIVQGAVGTAVLLTSVLVALSVYFVVSGDASYAGKGMSAVVDTILEISVDDATRASLAEVPGGMDLLKDEIQSSELVSMMSTYYAYLSAITAFTAIQLIGVFLAPLARVFAWILWKMNGNYGAA